MPAKAFIDTNVVIYALGPDSIKTPRAAALLADNPAISTQVLSETANVALKKLALPLSEAVKLLAMLEAVCQVEIVTPAIMYLALDIAGKYGFSWYDSLIVATALKADCAILYSEDMHHSQVIENRLAIINPFMD